MNKLKKLLLVGLVVVGFNGLQNLSAMDKQIFLEENGTKIEITEMEFEIYIALLNSEFKISEFKIDTLVEIIKKIETYLNDCNLNVSMDNVCAAYNACEFARKLGLKESFSLYGDLHGHLDDIFNKLVFF
ncbi:MAG: hypothetical protein SZ59_C0001G0067 [candidate division TM6 bacterium GW2011_GWF2_28_16]|nr:MAG: hypothetical protein SZ59_C0001G0067 [candidate division TM6 bacterium GW2011_GWF2_28_16]